MRIRKIETSKIRFEGNIKSINSQKLKTLKMKEQGKHFQNCEGLCVFLAVATENAGTPTENSTGNS